jgi:malate dehydrogenase (oxaloacetate-decarboxylating)(NADP+)
MEGKAVLFKRFADIDVFDIEVDTEDPDELIRFCEMLAPTVGGLNLEDIRAPECFIVEQTLRERLAIPVFHDDQHGTAIIAAAALINALELTDRRIEDVRVVFSGAGAAGIATARFFVHLGVRRENVLLVDSTGVISTSREDPMPPHKAEFLADTDRRTLAEALQGADAFVGVSVADLVTPEMLEGMARNPLVFALANPDPEIAYDVARSARPDAVVATGRSDFPNQVNNVLGFPFIFRGALDVRARSITEGMKTAAARALADLARQPVPESVLKQYGLEKLGFGPEYLIPKPFDPRVLWHVAPAVAETASAEGVAGAPIADLEAYCDSLQARFRGSYGLVHAVTTKARRHPLRVVYPHGADVQIVRAARRVLDEGIGSPIVIGATEEILSVADDIGIDLEGVEILDTSRERDRCTRYAEALYHIRQRKGMTLADAKRFIREPNYFGALMLHEDDADAVLGGLTTHYPDTLRPALQVLPLEEGRTIVSALYVVVIDSRPYFLADCAVNIDPTAHQLAEIALSAAETARDRFDVDPRVALISYSNFGSARGPEAAKVQEAVRICRNRAPEIPLDGEMQADTAVVDELLERRHPFNHLGGAANVLVFPNLTAANAAYKLLDRLGGAEVIGPILTGLSKSVHVLQRDADVGDVVNLTAFAVLDAQRKRST